MMLIFKKTLPKNHIISGLSEVYKHSIIGDRTLWNYLNLMQSNLTIIISLKNLFIKI